MGWDLFWTYAETASGFPAGAAIVALGPKLSERSVLEMPPWSTTIRYRQERVNRTPRPFATSQWGSCMAMIAQRAGTKRSRFAALNKSVDGPCPSSQPPETMLQ